jgi:hypothetical protein
MRGFGCVGAAEGVDVWRLLSAFVAKSGMMRQ